MEAPFLVERLARFSVWVPNWIHFDSIVVFWQSGANGLLIHTSLGNGFTTGAPLHSSRHGADQFQWVVKLPGILYARNPVNA